MAKAKKVAAPKAEEKIIETVQPITETPIVTVVESDNDSVGQSHEIKEEAPILSKVEVVDKPIDEKIVDYLKTRGNTGFIKLNDYLKSLYHTQMNEPPLYYRLAISKEIKSLLQKLVSNGDIAMQDERYLQLGNPYHFGADLKAANHDITTIDIYCKISEEGE